MTFSLFQHRALFQSPVSLSHSYKTLFGICSFNIKQVVSSGIWCPVRQDHKANDKTLLITYPGKRFFPHTECRATMNTFKIIDWEGFTAVEVKCFLCALLEAQQKENYGCLNPEIHASSPPHPLWSVLRLWIVPRAPRNPELTGLSVRAPTDCLWPLLPRLQISVYLPRIVWGFISCCWSIFKFCLGQRFWVASNITRIKALLACHDVLHLQCICCGVTLLQQVCLFWRQISFCPHLWSCGLWARAWVWRPSFRLTPDTWRLVMKSLSFHGVGCVSFWC